MAGLQKSQERVELGKIDNRAASVPLMFRNRVTATPNTEAFRYPKGGDWESVTWRQVSDRVDNIAAGLISLGINPEERVALASGTRYEWVVADFGILAAGAATTTVYPTTNAEDVAYIVSNSGSRIVIAEDQTQVDKLRERRDQLPAVDKVVIIDDEPQARPHPLIINALTHPALIPPQFPACVMLIMHPWLAMNEGTTHHPPAQRQDTRLPAEMVAHLVNRRRKR
jgi:long-subunit acyl-CoA synthetase (AMP-forming)